LDRVSVYAAQASFFVMISVVPFISLLSGILHAALPHAADMEQLLSVLAVSLPGDIYEDVGTFWEEISVTPTVSMVSISAVFIWWSAAKGMGAVREGIQTVYETPRKRGYFKKMLRSILYTLCFLALIITVTGALFFGEYLLDLLSSYFPLPWLSTLLEYRSFIFLFILTLFFSILFSAGAKGSSVVTHRFFSHTPGALFTSCSWFLFSQGYSYYMTHISRPQMLYGQLTGLCLIMLWLYFSMILLLCGAEINKLFFAKQK